MPEGVRRRVSRNLGPTLSRIPVNDLERVEEAEGEGDLRHVEPGLPLRDPPLLLFISTDLELET